MHRHRLGTTEIELSAIGLGGAWVGHDLSDAAGVTQAGKVLAAAEESGVNWIDTSENYFDTGNEAVIGAALRSITDSFLVCSKVAPAALKSGGASGFRPAQVRRACADSLRRLGRDHIDLYLLHWPDRSGEVPLADTWGAMAGLVEAGHVRAIGLSNYDREQVAGCHEDRRVDVIQTGLSVLDCLEDRDMIAWCGGEDIAVTIYEPLASGLLTDVPFEQVRDRWANSPWQDVTMYPEVMCLENAEPIQQIVAGLRRIADQLDATVAQVALAWVLAQSGVSSALVGSSNPGRVRSNAAAGDLLLPEQAMQVIDHELLPLTAHFAKRP